MATAGASILDSISEVNHGMIIRTYSNASTHRANHHFVSAAADTDIRPASVEFPMTRQASTCAVIIRKRKRARRA